MNKPTTKDMETVRKATALIVGALCFAARSAGPQPHGDPFLDREAKEALAHDCITLGQCFAIAAEERGCGAIEIMEAFQGGDKRGTGSPG